MVKPPVRPVDEWDFPNPAELQEQVRRAVAEFAPEADLDAMTVVLNLFRLAGRIQ